MFKDNFAGAGAVLSVDITGYTHDGRGVARHEGRVIFVQGALRGERVVCELLYERKKVFYARLLEVITPSAERREPECPTYAGCGGCALQHMSYGEELAFKQERVRDALERIGGLRGFELRPVIAAERLYHYRNKGVFHVARDGRGRRLVFWDEASHRPAEAACTLLFPPAAGEALEAMAQAPPPEGVEDVLLRYSFAQDKLLLILQLADGGGADCGAYLRRLAARLPRLAVYGVKRGGEYRLFSAEKYLVDKLGGTEYRIAPDSFFQVNNAQTLRLLEALRQSLADCRVLLDIYCGIGTLGLYLAQNLPGLKRLAGLEANLAAAADAAANARLNNIANAEFWQGRAEDKFAELRAHCAAIDAAIVDPPRCGCDKRFLEQLVQLAPAKLVYVSCNSASLARDLRLLCAQGYAVDFVQPIDMFPRTGHVECVVLLSKVQN